MFNFLVWSGDFPPIPSNFNISLLISKITIYKKRENVHTTRASILFLTLLTSTSVESSTFQVSASSCFILAILTGRYRQWVWWVSTFAPLWKCLMPALAGEFSTSHFHGAQAGKDTQQQGWSLKYEQEEERLTWSKWDKDQNFSDFGQVIIPPHRAPLSLLIKMNLLILYTAQWNDLMTIFIFLACVVCLLRCKVHLKYHQLDEITHFCICQVLIKDQVWDLWRKKMPHIKILD